MTTPATRLYADELPVGKDLDLGTYRLDREEILEFANAWDPQDFHTDLDVATAGVFNGLIGSGVHSIAIFQRLAVLGAYQNWHIVAARRINSIDLTAPIRPGDVLTGTLRVTDVTPHKNRSKVNLVGRLINQDAQAVMEIDMDAYVRIRPTEDPQT